MSQVGDELQVGPWTFRLEQVRRQDGLEFWECDQLDPLLTRSPEGWRVHNMAFWVPSPLEAIHLWVLGRIANQQGHNQVLANQLGLLLPKILGGWKAMGNLRGLLKQVEQG